MNSFIFLDQSATTSSFATGIKPPLFTFDEYLIIIPCYDHLSLIDSGNGILANNAGQS